MQPQILNLFPMLKLLLLQKFLEKLLNLNMLMLNQLNIENKQFTKQIRDYLNDTVLIIPIYLTQKFWRKFFMDITLQIFREQICNWVWKPRKFLLLDCNFLSDYWRKFLSLNSFAKINTESFSIKKNSYISNIKLFYNVNGFFTSYKISWLLQKTLLNERFFFF